MQRGNVKQGNVALKSIVASAGLVAVAALALNAARVEQVVSGAAPLSTRAVPYTAVLQDYRLKPDGTQTPIMKLTMAVRSDGSRAMESVNTVPGNNFAERILDFSSGRKSYIIESSQRKSTTFNPTRRTSSPPWLPDPQNNCLFPGSDFKPKVVGLEDVSGYRTVKLTSGEMTLWLAIEHGCALIKDRAEWNDGEVSEKRLVAFVQGEPSPSLFDDPAGFEEVPPSVIFHGAAMPASEDTYYYAHRPVDSPERPQK